MRRFAVLVAALLGLAWPITAGATTITVYNNRTQYDAAVAAQAAWTVHGVPLDLPFQNPPALGMTSTPGTVPVNVVTLTGGVAYLSNQANVIDNAFKMTPAKDVRAIGFDYLVGNPGNNGTITETISVNGAVAATTINTNGSAPLAFFGVISDSPIASLLIKRTGSGNITPNQIEFIKGITFATSPIPAALPLFASALGGLGLVGWRRRQRDAA